MEGVMMRGSTSYATAVRDADGVIRLEAKRSVPLTKRNKFLGLPLVRGMVSFFDSFISGMKIMMRSAEVYGEGEPSKFEKWLSEKLKINLMSVILTISVILGIGLAVALFIFLPAFLTGLFISQADRPYLFTVIEGIMKIILFISYLALTSLIKDIRRTYMYHGAEHKTISCYEKGMELTVENVRTCRRVHDRCGTTFMFFVVTVSILVFCLFNVIFPHIFTVEGFAGTLLRVLIKILLLPIVAGLSYELLKALAKTDSPLVYPLKAPGLLLQRITTREPDDSMIEVAITSFTKVLKMDEDPAEPECTFAVARKACDLTAELKARFAPAGIDESDAEWFVAIGAGIKRSEVNKDVMISPANCEKINKWAEERLTGRPLAYIVGDTDFCGYTLAVDENVLIPRPETEELVELACKYITAEHKVLDIGTGSGAIAIAVKLGTGADVTATDISEKALEVARKNAEANRAEINFIQSDLFENFNGITDFIISNPPYINGRDMEKLPREIKDFEPHCALYGGEDGLDFYRRLAAQALPHLSQNGMILLECGYDQAAAVARLFQSYGTVEIVKDMSGTDRFVRIERK